MIASGAGSGISGANSQMSAPDCHMWSISVASAMSGEAIRVAVEAVTASVDLTNTRYLRGSNHSVCAGKDRKNYAMHTVSEFNVYHQRLVRQSWNFAFAPEIGRA